MRNRRGEIATILTIGTLIVIGVTAVISSLGLKDKRTTSSRASEVYCIYTTKSSCENLAKVGDCPNTGTVCSVCKNGKYRCPLTKDDSYVAPTLAPCSEKKCTSGTGEPYWVRSSKNYSDDKCNEVISKPINDWCRGSGLIPIPSKTPVPSTTNTKTYCSGTTGSYYYKCTNGNYVDSTCNKEKIPDVTKWCVPTISTSPIPSQDTCTKGQKFVGTLGYNVETPEQICSAHNGVYVGSSQQGQENDTAGKSQRWACCAVSDANSVCPKPGLGYACCVQDTRECPSGDIRYRWYGCTGQVCSATKINTTGGFTHLFDCPLGVNPASPENCSSVLPTPKLSIDGCEDYGSYGLLGGCHEKCTDPSKECKAADGDTVQRFCCPKPPPEVPQPEPEVPPEITTPECQLAPNLAECRDIDLLDKNNTYKYEKGQCCPKVSIPPATEETPIPGSSDDCMSIQTLKTCDSTEYGTSGFPVKKKIGSVWYCCKTNTSTPPSQPGVITPEVSTSPVNVTPLPEKKGKVSVSCKDFCDSSDASTNSIESIYQAVGSVGYYNEKEEFMPGAEVWFECACKEPETQKEKVEKANTRTITVTNGCTYGITVFFRDKWLTTKRTITAGGNGVFTTVATDGQEVEMTYRQTGSLAVERFSRTMEPGDSAYFYPISGTLCTQTPNP